MLGYVRLQNIIDGEANKIDYSKITHLNIAFINPDATGTFAPIFGLKTFVNKIHQKQRECLRGHGF